MISPSFPLALPDFSSSFSRLTLFAQAWAFCIGNWITNGPACFGGCTEDRQGVADGWFGQNCLWKYLSTAVDFVPRIWWRSWRCKHQSTDQKRSIQHRYSHLHQQTHPRRSTANGSDSTFGRIGRRDIYCRMSLTRPGLSTIHNTSVLSSQKRLLQRWRLSIPLNFQKQFGTTRDAPTCNCEKNWAPWQESEPLIHGSREVAKIHIQKWLGVWLAMVLRPFLCYCNFDCPTCVKLSHLQINPKSSHQGLAVVWVFKFPHYSCFMY